MIRAAIVGYREAAVAKTHLVEVVVVHKGLMKEDLAVVVATDLDTVVVVEVVERI
jgi:hypothetical protein